MTAGNPKAAGKGPFEIRAKEDWQKNLRVHRRRKTTDVKKRVRLSSRGTPVL